MSWKIRKFGYFVGKQYVKFGHFVDFSYIHFRAKMSCPPKVDTAPTPMVDHQRSETSDYDWQHPEKYNLA